MAFLSRQEVEALGFRRVGENVLISDRSSIYGASRISIGDHTRIDDFTVLSAGTDGIDIGRNVHIAVYSSLIGAARISLGDFAGLSSRVAIYSSNDDYSGEFLTGPTVPAKFSNVTHSSVSIGRHVIVGAGAVILPGVTLGDGVAIGALSLVNGDCDPFKVYVGVPARAKAKRSRALLELEEHYLSSGD